MPDHSYASGNGSRNYAKELRDAARTLRYYDRERLIEMMQYAAGEIEQLEKRVAELTAGRHAASRAVKKKGRWTVQHPNDSQ